MNQNCANNKQNEFQVVSYKKKSKKSNNMKQSSSNKKSSQRNNPPGWDPIEKPLRNYKFDKRPRAMDHEQWRSKPIMGKQVKNSIRILPRSVSKGNELSKSDTIINNPKQIKEKSSHPDIPKKLRQLLQVNYRKSRSESNNVQPSDMFLTGMLLNKFTTMINQPITKSDKYISDTNIIQEEIMRIYTTLESWTSDLNKKICWAATIQQVELYIPAYDPDVQKPISIISIIESYAVNNIDKITLPIVFTRTEEIANGFQKYIGCLDSNPTLYLNEIHLQIDSLNLNTTFPKFTNPPLFNELMGSAYNTYYIKYIFNNLLATPF